MVLTRKRSFMKPAPLKIFEAAKIADIVKRVTKCSDEIADECSDDIMDYIDTVAYPKAPVAAPAPKEPTYTFVIGDVVCLKIDGPLMLVTRSERRRDPLATPIVIRELVHVTWFDVNSRPNTGTFPVECFREKKSPDAPVENDQMGNLTGNGEEPIQGADLALPMDKYNPD